MNLRLVFAQSFRAVWTLPAHRPDRLVDKFASNIELVYPHSTCRFQSTIIFAVCDGIVGMKYMKDVPPCPLLTPADQVAQSQHEGRFIAMSIDRADRQHHPYFSLPIQSTFSAIGPSCSGNHCKLAILSPSRSTTFALGSSR